MRTDLTDRRFGRLSVTGASRLTAAGYREWLCRCDCGQERWIDQSNLRRGRSRSCGCWRSQRAGQLNLHHGFGRQPGRSPEARAWSDMINRCMNPAHRRYADYGGRGIKVCIRWQRSFLDFLADMGARPSSWHSLDRIDNNGSYEPGNCRWATRSQQQRNKRRARVVP